MSAVLAAAKDAWGAGIPDWVVHLAAECDATSQSAVARKIDYSPSLVNQVLKASYKGDLDAVKDVVRGVFLNGVVTCPELGEIPANECQGWRKKAKKFGNANPQRVKMFRACRRCPRNMPTKGGYDASSS